MADYSERIKTLRIKHNYSQQRLADLLNVNKQTVSQYERGVRFPSKENLEALCDVFNVSSDYLIGRDDVSPVLLSGDELNLINNIRNTAANAPQSIAKLSPKHLELISTLSEDELKMLIDFIKYKKSRD